MAIHVLNARPPIVQVGLNVSEAAARAGLGSPLPGGVVALIDTGASQTAISRAVLALLRPQRYASDLVRRSDGIEEERPTYSVRVAFEPNFADPLWPLKARFFPVIAVEGRPATPGVDVLIGQDLLAGVVLNLDGPGGRMLLMY